MQKQAEWLNECYRTGATHMLLCVDRENFEEFPVKVLPGDDVHTTVDFYKHQPTIEVVEVYSMSLPIEKQMNSPVPVFNY